MQQQECAFVSVLKEYKDPLNSDHIVHVMHILHIHSYLILSSAWVDKNQSDIVYRRSEQAQFLYVIPVTSLLGSPSLVPVGATGMISFDMRRESADFLGAACDKTKDTFNGCRWWYVNSWALGW